MSKRLPNSDSFSIDGHANQPITRPLKIGYYRMLELSMTVRTDDQEVSWVMANLWVKMVYFKVRLAVPFFESEATKLALSIIHLPEQNANSRGHTLVAVGATRNYSWAW